MHLPKVKSDFSWWHLLVSITFFFILHVHLFAQNDSTDKPVFQLECNAHAGKLIKIHGEYPANNITTLSELSLSWKSKGRKLWQPVFRFPSYGVSIVHAQFGNQDVLGQAIALIPTMRFEHWKNNRCRSWRAGFGIAGFNKPYDAIDNPGNLVIGSRFTNMSMFRWSYSAPISKTLRYNVGFSITHCSNSHVSVPNIGANLIALTAGISFCKKANLLSTEYKKTASEKVRENWSPGIQTLLGIHEFPGTTRPADGPKYFIYGCSIGASKRFNKKGKMSIVLNYHYYTAYRDYILSQELFPSSNEALKKAQNIVVALGYEWTYGRFALFVQAGANVYDPTLNALNKVWDLPKHGFLHEYTANKLGYKFYLFNQNITASHFISPYISTAVKTNGGTADFLEFSVGFDFHNKKQIDSTKK